ncbi:MAG TPA: hypothetical protein VMB47_10255 [Candidatus Aquilonibacter sp.]|nr:hypothetical protein [Candidatus Aquilonibacter sp.]
MPETTTTVAAETASEKSYWEFWKLRRERAHLLTDPGQIGDEMPQIYGPGANASRMGSGFASTSSARRFEPA